MKLRRHELFVFSLVLMLSLIVFSPLKNLNGMGSNQEFVTIRLSASSPDALLTPYCTLPFYHGTTSSWYSALWRTLDLNHDGQLELVMKQFDPDYIIAMNATGYIYWVNTPNQYASIFEGDFDRDGYLDDIVAFMVFAPQNYFASTITAWNETGGVIRRSVNGTISYSPKILNGLVGDFNRDGYLDDIIVRIENATGYYLCAMTYFNHQFLWNFSLGTDSVLGATNPCDLHHDGFLDDFVFMTSNQTYAVNSTDILWKVNAGGFRYGITAPSAVGDLDHDGFTDDIVLISVLNNSVLALDNNGNLLWNFPSTNAMSVGICDSDNDTFIDETCVVEGNRAVLLNETGGIIWELSPGFNLQRLVIADATNDGRVEFLISYERLLVLNRSGAILWAENYGDYNMPVTVADVMGDGIASDMLWNIGGDLTVFRWGAPNITVSFVAGAELTLPLNSYQKIYMRYDSYEPYMTLTVTRVIGGDHIPIPMLPNSSFTTSYGMTLRESGTTVFNVSLEYYGVTFCTASIIIHGPDIIPIVVVLVVCVAAVVVVWEFRKRHQKTRSNVQ